MDKKVQAKSITDEQCMDAFRRARGRHGVPQWATLWDIQEELREFPPKVVRAKLAALVKKGKLDGLAMDGHRGDFEER